MNRTGTVLTLVRETLTSAGGTVVDIFLLRSVSPRNAAAAAAASVENAQPIQEDQTGVRACVRARVAAMVAAMFVCVRAYVS